VTTLQASYQTKTVLE